MATAKSQRIVIWVITVVMAVGTLGSFFVFILASNNGPVADNSQADLQKQLEEFKKQQKEQSAERAISSKPLEGYAAEAFDAAGVTELKVEQLVAGEGKDVTAESTISANYFGWTADGKLFDSSNQNGTVTPAEFSLKQVIAGWTEGLTGSKEGSIVKLTIPTDKAYGATAAENGQPAGPLQFIVEIKSVK